MTAANHDVGAKTPRVAVLIPCYNEATTIAQVVGDFAAALPEARIYVFDNNSTDATADIAAGAGATVVHSPVQGKGNVVRHMFGSVKADLYVLTDGDGTYPAAAAPKLIEQFVHQDLDMLVGTRLTTFEPGSFRGFHLFGNHVISGLISLLFRTRLTDVLSGYRVLSRSLAQIVNLRSGGFEVETELTLQALTKRLAIRESPIEYRPREDGSESKLSTWSDGFLILKCMFMLFKDYKPLVFFSTAAGIFALASLASGIAPIRDFIATGLVLHVPRAILAAGLAVLALVSFTAGLILDTIAKFHQETIDLWKQMLSRSDTDG